MITLASGFGALLSLVFLVSAFGKLADLPGTASGLRSLRIPYPKAHSAFALATPIAELIVVVGLWLPVRFLAAAAALLGLLMMIAFTVVIARALRFDEAIHCSCFGSLGSPTVTGSTLARNITLSAVALVAFLFAAMSPGLWPGRTLTDEPLSAFLLLALLVLASLITVLIGSGTDRLAGESSGSPTRLAPSVPSAPTGSHPADPGHATPDTPGVDGGIDIMEDDNEADYLRTPIPFGTLTTPTGESHTLRELATTQAVLLIFLSPGCGPCRSLLPQIAPWSEALVPLVRTIVVFAKSEVDLEADVAEQVAGLDMYDSKNEVSQLFGALGRPSAVLMGADGLVAGGPVTGTSKVTEFVDDIQEQLRDNDLLDADTDTAGTGHRD